MDFLHALIPGAVIDGQGDDETDEILEGVYVFRQGEGGAIKGFGVSDAFAWDALGNDEELVWGADGLRFDVPTLALRDAAIGEILLAAQRTLTGSTPDVVFFDHAVAAGSDEELEDAEEFWRLSLAAGGMKAHFGLGYTLVSLDRPREAFGHLCMYTEMTPRLAWAWVWRGRAAQDMGDKDEARKCFARAYAIDVEEETDAAERLDAVEND